MTNSIKHRPLDLSIDPIVQNFQIAILTTAWNKPILLELEKGALTACEEAGIPQEQIEIFEVPGAFELPQVATALAFTKRYQIIIPLGCIIKGDTIHDEVLAHAVTKALDETGRTTGVAVSLGVLTVENEAQAMDRAGGKHGNKGYDAVQSAFALASILYKIEASMEGESEDSCAS